MPHCVIILGHSFVCRLEQFIARSDDHRVSNNFNLSTDEVAVHFVGKRGASLQQNRALGLDYVTQLQTSVVLIRGVSNDLPVCDGNKSLNDIFRELVDFVITLRYGKSVKKVEVLQTLYRLPPTFPVRYKVDTPWFNSSVDELNRTMSSYLMNVDGTFFFCLTGFWSKESQQLVFLPDGVHLNDKGNIKYYNNLRASIVSCLKSIDNGG